MQEAGQKGACPANAVQTGTGLGLSPATASPESRSLHLQCARQSTKDVRKRPVLVPMIHCGSKVFVPLTGAASRADRARRSDAARPAASIGTPEPKFGR